jgi:ATPase subunit of ABC transporter with duplicated ATPase domains
VLAGAGHAIGQRRDVLFLDEPTNHLSLTLAEELEEALQTTPSAVVIATHEQRPAPKSECRPSAA